MKSRGLIQKLSGWVLAVSMLFATGCDLMINPDFEVGSLKCEYRMDPLGIDVIHPRLSWVIQSAQEGQKQSAYRILIASNPEKLKNEQGDIWDSKKIFSDQTSQVVYRGTSLKSRDQVWWKVKIWDKEGATSGWSEVSTWSMGLLDINDWEARWISDPEAAENQEEKMPRNGFHSRLFTEADHSLTLTMDLGQIQDFDSVRFFPARPYDWKDTPGFLYPVRLKLEACNQMDFKDARVLVDHHESDIPNPGDQPQTYRTKDASGRFIRITIPVLTLRDEGNWGFALNEIEVLLGDQNLALGAEVTASDAIETDTWKPEYLTDGITQTLKPQRALPATYVRKPFTVSQRIRKAIAYVSARGLYQFYLNGQRVGDQLLAPEWTSYEKRISYQTYDVTDLLNRGENVAGAILGEGWYAGQLMVIGRFAYGRYPSFLAQIEIEAADGSVKTVVTDDTWLTTSNGPILYSSIYHGEYYDANLGMKRWNRLGFKHDRWTGAKVDALDSVELVWLPNEPIRVEKELHPVSMTEPEVGVYVLDFGQNMVGWCKIIGQATAGITVKIRHGEAVNEDGTLYTTNLRQALQTDTYMPDVSGSFEFEPHFTYHGFRYIEISGLAEKPELEEVTGKVFHSSSPFVSQFECSDSSLNQLRENIRWTQRANLMSSPNDCPQRDERFGWMGDIQAFAQTAAFTMDMAAFFTKFLGDTRDDQADDGRFPDFAPHPGDQNKSFSGVPAWGDAGVFVPWTAYVNYADTQLLRDQFDAAKRWIDYIHRNNPDLIWRNGRNNDYNDWLNGDEIKYEGWPKTGGAVPKELFATAFFARSTQIVAEMAKIIDKPNEEKQYGDLANQIKVAFNEAFVSPDGRIQGNTQGGYALALNYHLLPEELQSKAIGYLAENIKEKYDGHLSTGIQTTHRAMMELSDRGYGDLAWKLIMDRRFPSWLYMIDNGATTIWERWDGYVKDRGFQDPGMNSLNHWALGSVGEWMWRNIIGLQPDEESPGWKHFTIAPKPGGGVTWAKGEYESIHGRIQVEWKIRNKTFKLDVTIPPNTTATVVLPDGGKLNLGSGKHHLESIITVQYLYENK